MLAATGAAALQDAVGVGPVFVTGQVVVVQLLPAAPTAAVQDAARIGVGPVTTVLHVVVVQLLPAVAVMGTQEPLGTFVVLFVEHEVVV